MGLFLIYLRYVKCFEHILFFLVNYVSLCFPPAENPNRAGSIFGHGFEEFYRQTLIPIAQFQAQNLSQTMLYQSGRLTVINEKSVLI